MAHEVRSMRDRATQLLALEESGALDREEQAKRMGLSIGHVSRIRGWIREHGIGAERRVERPRPPDWGGASPIRPLPEHFFSHLGVRLDKRLVERLRAYCEKKDVTVDGAVSIAIEHYLKTRPR